MAITDPEERCGGETIMSEAEVIAAYQALLRQAYESNPLRTTPKRPLPFPGRPGTQERPMALGSVKL